MMENIDTTLQTQSYILQTRLHPSTKPKYFFNFFCQKRSIWKKFLEWKLKLVNEKKQF